MWALSYKLIAVYRNYTEKSACQNSEKNIVIVDVNMPEY